MVVSAKKIAVFFFVTIWLCNAMPTLAQHDYPDLTQSYDTLRQVFKEDFEQNYNNWYVDAADKKQKMFSMFVGRYNINRPNEGGWNAITNIAGTIDTSKDFVIKTQISMRTNDENSGAGIIWGNTATEQQMLFFKAKKPVAQFITWKQHEGEKIILEKNTGYKDFYLDIEIRRKNDSLLFYFTPSNEKKLLAVTRYIPLPQNNRLGFYVSGKMDFQADYAYIYEVVKEDEAEQNQRALHFQGWIAKAAEKEKIIADLEKKKKLSDKTAQQLSDTKRFLGQIYYQMANIKWWDKDTNTAKVFYTLSADMGYPVGNRSLGAFYEKLYAKQQLPEYKTLALEYYFKAVRTERDDLGFPPALKAYYKLKYPYITDFTLISPTWQREYLVPKNKSDYDEFVVRTKAAKESYAKLQAQINVLNSRPKFVVKLVNIDRMNKSKCYVASTNGTAPLSFVSPALLKMGDYYYDEKRKDFVICYIDGGPAELKNTPGIYMNNAYNFQFDIVRDICKVCNGQGSIRGSSSYTYQVATGQLASSYGASIVGQTQSVSTGFVRETRTIQGAPTFTKCTACNGTGGPPEHKDLIIKDW